jgi:hypothetical protein
MEYFDIGTLRVTPCLGTKQNSSGSNRESWLVRKGTTDEFTLLLGSIYPNLAQADPVEHQLQSRSSVQWSRLLDSSVLFSPCSRGHGTSLRGSGSQELVGLLDQTRHLDEVSEGETLRQALLQSHDNCTEPRAV